MGDMCHGPIVVAMTPRAAALHIAPTPPRRDERQLARSITVTWWYTLSGVLVFELVVVFVATVVISTAASPAAVAVTGIGGIVWWGATLALLLRYRRGSAGMARREWPTVAVPLLLCAAYGVTAAVLTGMWSIGGFAVIQPLLLLAWPPGVRLRLVVAATLVLIGLWTLDQQSAVRLSGGEPSSWWTFGLFAMALPMMSVLTLWWWDVLVRLDDARAAAGRLAATQERLRVATDVHDLQGHHLQVIALQLELAERLMDRDQPAAMEQLRQARRSVDEARQGTREIAAQFRTVSLTDEIANAVDLLRAAGATVDASVDADADLAPASVIGPVIRETTTNVLRHGGGKRARLVLRRAAEAWRYEIVNDPGTGSVAADGAGLAGIERRVRDAGGTVAVRREPHEFAVVVTVPEAQR